jgi:hypothetical protein
VDSLTHSHSRIESKLDEREVVDRELVVARRDAPTVLDFVKEPFDEISRAVEVRG